MSPDQKFMVFALFFGAFGLFAAIMALVKVVRADYASIFVFILIEYLIFAGALLVGLDSSTLIMLLTGWGFVSVTAAVTIVGSDIRDAIRTQSAAAVRAEAQPPTSAKSAA